MSTDSLLRIRIITPEGSIVEADALFSVNIPLADDFPIEIHPGHAPLIAETLEGIVKFQNEDEEHEIKLHAGILDVRKNLVTILTPGSLSTTTHNEEIPSEKEFDRLMETLIEKLNPSEDLK